MVGRFKNLHEFPEYQSVSNSVTYIFCIYVITWYLQIGNRITSLGNIRIEMIIAIILIPLAISNNLKSTENVENKIKLLIFLFSVLLFVMTIFSYDFQRSWDVFYNRVVKFSFMGFFIYSFSKNPKALKYFILAFMLACFKMGQEGLIGQITGSLVWENQGVMRLHGSTLMYRHPNSFAGMALGTIPFIIYLYPIVNKWIKSLLLIQLIFSLNIILHSGSRTGYVAFLGMIFILIMRSKKKLKIFLILMIITSIGFAYIPEQYKNRFKSIFTSTDTPKYHDDSLTSLHGGDSSKEKRIEIIKDAISIFYMHPFGIGVSAFPSIRKDVFGREQDTHNLYLEIATNLGIQGLIIFIALIYSLFKTLLIIRKKLNSDLIKLKISIHKFEDEKLKYEVNFHIKDIQFLIAITDSVILFIFIRLFLGIFGMDLYEIYWWFSIGIALSISTMLPTTNKRSKYFNENYFKK